jgi:S-formylglutathione hydrolase FrmB
VQYDVPSLKGNVDVKKSSLNGTNKLTAWVRLPAGYDDEPDRRWPVLYLLHGWEDNSDGWLDPKKGNINAVLPADFAGIVVMPEGGKEWFLNWADASSGRQWQDYMLDEVVPFMEQNLRIAPGRGNHAIGGLSMGAYGSMRLSAALPTYFGHAISFSGMLDIQDLIVSPIWNLVQLGKAGYDATFGSQFGRYATVVNPVKNPRAYANSIVDLHWGTPTWTWIFSLNIRERGLATLESAAKPQGQRFRDALRGTGANVSWNDRPGGSHDWKWWRQDLADAVKRGLFRTPPAATTKDATNWEYATMATHGNAWGFGYKMAKPSQIVTLSRKGNVLSGRGRGTITLSGGAADWDSSGNGTLPGCTATATLPFDVALPDGC